MKPLIPFEPFDLMECIRLNLSETKQKSPKPQNGACCDEISGRLDGPISNMNCFSKKRLIDNECFFFSLWTIRSFVPPVRDEESETQRKAHAKRVRETRRSTQGVTLEEVKTAEQLAKKKQAETVRISFRNVFIFIKSFGN